MQSCSIVVAVVKDWENGIQVPIQLNVKGLAESGKLLKYWAFSIKTITIWGTQQK